MNLSRALLYAGIAAVAGCVILVFWFGFFFALSERDSAFTWALYHIVRWVWTVLLFGGALAFLGIALAMMTRRTE